MIRIAQMVIPDYNLYKRTGFREGIPIPNQNAAERIVMDMVQGGYYVDFVEALIKIDREGYMGHRYTLRGLPNVIDTLIDEGYRFDNVSGQFFEDQKEHITQNWGRLRNGDEKKMTMLCLDIAGSSELVKNNPRAKIEKAYNDVRTIIEKSVTSRMGRLWAWQGDGALAAFLFGPMEKMAVFAGMEIIHEIFFYNKLRNPLNSPINIRLGAHVGQTRYWDNEVERLKNETAKEAMVLEALASANALGVSYNLFLTLDQQILGLFSAEKTGRGRKFRLYKMGVEK